MRAKVSPKVREKLAEVRQIIDAAKERKEKERLKESKVIRVDTYLRKRKAREAIAELMRKSQ
ncbi:hypothetical protein D3C78_1922670 [compost metagenome]